MEKVCDRFLKMSKIAVPALNCTSKAISYTVGFRQSKTDLFDWTFFRLDSFGPSYYRQLSRFYNFCVLPRGGWCEGVLLYSSRNWLAALCFALSPRATAR